MNLQTGIIGKTDGWKTILGQEGVPHEVVQGEPSPDAYAAVVVNDDADDRELGIVRQYIRGGGSVLCSAKMFAMIKGTTYQKRSIGFVEGTGDSLFAPAGAVEIGTVGGVAWSANELPCDDGTPSAFVGSFEGGHCIALPIDPSHLVKTSGSVRRSFYSPSARLPFEKVSSVSKNGIRRLVRIALQQLYALRQLPYVHLWQYPDGAPSALILRIDTDYSSQGDIEHLYEFLRSHRIPASWFVDVKSQEGFLWRYAQMQGQEVGIHCYVHKTYGDELRNHENILKARNKFREADLGAAGFAAPYGEWNPGLAKVVKEFRFGFSSEFSWDYDNFPSEPWIDKKTRGVLQVPVHPVSIGTLRRQGYAAEAMTAYFRRVIDEKMSLNEPLFFYHHPRDKHHDVLDALILAAGETGAHTVTMGDYAAWWKGRVSEGMKVELRGDTIMVDPQSAPIGHSVRILNHEGKAALVPVADKTPLASAVWKWLPKPYAYPNDTGRARAFNPRIPLTLAVDALFAFRRKR